MSASRARASAPNEDPLIVLGEEPGVLRFYGYKNVDVAIWDSTPTMASAAHLGRLCATRGRTLPGKFSSVVVITPEAGPIKPDVWEALQRAAACRRTPMCGLYFVLEHDGFVASMIRGTLTSFLLLAKRPPPLRVVRTVREAATLLAERHERDTSVPVDPGELLRALESARTPRRSEVRPSMT